MMMMMPTRIQEFIAAAAAAETEDVKTKKLGEDESKL